MFAVDTLLATSTHLLHQLSSIEAGEDKMHRYFYKVCWYNAHSAICTSSSPAAAAGAAGAGSPVSFGVMLCRYTSRISPSRMRKSPSAVTPSSWTPLGPMIPSEVLLMVSSLSCWRVSRSACSPCRISSSSVPTAGKGVDVRWTERTGRKGSYSPRNSHSASRDRSSHSVNARR